MSSILAVRRVDAPREVHELIEAQAGERPAEPHHHEDEEVDLQEEPDPAGEEGSLEAAEEQRGGHHGDDHHVRVLGEEEHGEAHAGVLGVVAGHDLRLPFGHAEGGPLVLGHDGGEEHQEGQGLQEDPPVGESDPIQPPGQLPEEAQQKADKKAAAEKAEVEREKAANEAAAEDLKKKNEEELLKKNVEKVEVEKVRRVFGVGGLDIFDRNSQ